MVFVGLDLSRGVYLLGDVRVEHFTLFSLFPSSSVKRHHLVLWRRFDRKEQHSTGDHKDTAIAIGTTLGLVNDEYPIGITGPELDAMDEDQLKEAVIDAQYICSFVS
jgi:hypothetical protein